MLKYARGKRRNIPCLRVVHGQIFFVVARVNPTQVHVGFMVDIEDGTSFSWSTVRPSFVSQSSSAPHIAFIYHEHVFKCTSSVTMLINYVTPAFYCMRGSTPLGRQGRVCAIWQCNRNEEKYSCCVGILISVSRGRRVINTYRCIKLRCTKVSCVLQPPTERFIVQPPAGRPYVWLLSSTMKLTLRVMQYLSARVSFVICQMTEEVQQGVITGLAEIAILFYFFPHHFLFSPYS